MTPSTMRAVVYDQPREFTVKEVPLRDPEPGEVRLKVVQGGVCGTDLHLHEGGFITSYPLTPGHENVGTVEALGDGVDSFRVGELVAVNPNTTCGKCPACRSGDRLYCPSFGGWGTLKPGGFADYLIVPEEHGGHVVLLGGDRLLMSTSAPQTTALFRDRGYDVVTVDISEYEKLEGCVTCLSVRLRG